MKKTVASVSLFFTNVLLSPQLYLCMGHDEESEGLRNHQPYIPSLRRDARLLISH